LHKTHFCAPYFAPPRLLRPGATAPLCPPVVTPLWYCVMATCSSAPFLETTKWSGGALWAPPAGSGAQPQPKSILMHFSLKIWHLVATILIIFLRINWPNLNFVPQLIYFTSHPRISVTYFASPGVPLNAPGQTQRGKEGGKLTVSRQRKRWTLSAPACGSAKVNVRK